MRFPRPPYGRRVNDRPGLGLLTSRLEGLAQIRWQPVAGGQFLVLASGAIAVFTAPLLRPSDSAWIAIATVSGILVAALGVSAVLDWKRLPGPAVLAFPLIIWAALAGLGLTTHGVAGNFAGMIVLSFAYVGLTQKSGVALLLVPIAVPTYICAFGGWSSVLLPRLIITIAVWVLLGELLAAFTARQAALSLALQSAAHTDPLTGIGNRRDLHLRLAASRPGDTVVICDLDHFKHLNDTLGHLAGDQVLADFGMLLRTCLRSDDYSARFGGEEFVLLVPATSGTDVSALLRRLHENWAVLQPHVTFSAGCAVRSGTTAEETLHEADTALYAAKRAGRNRDYWAHATPPADVPQRS